MSCPADGPVTFHWKGDPDFEMNGTLTIDPDETGQAWVLAAEHTVAGYRKMLQNPDVQMMLDLFIETGENLPPIPSWGMMRDLYGLADHPDRKIRRQVVEALFRWVRDTSSDPFEPDDPEIVPSGFLTALSQDPDHGVRRKTAALIREIRGGELSAEAGRVLKTLGTDPHRGVRRVATAVLALSVTHDAVDPLEAWNIALKRVEQERGPGRKAAVTLAKLHAVVPRDEIDPDAALDRVLTHQPEKGWRVWYAWRKELPFRRDRAEQLIYETRGLHGGLLQFWETEHRDELESILAAWPEPDPVRRDYIEQLRGFAHKDAQEKVKDIERAVIENTVGDDALKP